MLFLTLLLYFIGALNIFLGALVLVRDKRKLSNVSFFGVATSIGLWCVGIAGYYTVQSSEIALYWMRLYYAAPITLVISLVLFAMSYPDQRVKKSLLIALLSLPLIGVLLLALLPHAIVSLVTVTEYARQVSLNIHNYYLYSILIVPYFALGLAVALYRSRRGEGTTKRQLKVFFVGAAISTIMGLVFNLLLPGIGNYTLIWVGPLATTVFIMVMAHVMSRYKMFDIRSFVVRSTAYVITTGLLGMLYIAPAVLVFLWITDRTIPFNQVLFIIVIGTIVATNYHHVRGWFDKLTNLIFYRDKYDRALLLAEVNKVLARSNSVDTLSEATLKLIVQSLRPEYCFTDIYNGAIADHLYRKAFGTDMLDLRELHVQLEAEVAKKHTLHFEHQIRENRSNAETIHVFKISLKDQDKKISAGFLVMGPRKSGSKYSSDDIKTLEAITSSLSIALQNAFQFEEIQQFNMTLQQRVEDATRKLKTSNEKLKKMDEAKDEFISMASHQLRTPLTSVKGYVSMVLDGDVGPITDQQRQLLKQSFLSSERMANLISDLLNLSRINTGKFAMELVPIDLRQIIATELEQLRDTAESKGLSITYKAPETFPILTLDENKMHQVVMNLVDNAIYYTHEGGTIALTLTETPSAVEFRVTDTGIGVPRDDQRHLFSKMYRAENARRARPDGTGLGLFMVKKVVVAQGGAILFDSVEGKGSTFGFRFNKADHIVPNSAT